MIRLKSPAKLNLYLRILNKRPDGYHNIVTLFERINLCDEITICRGDPRGRPLTGRAAVKAAPTIEITCSDPSVPVGPKNLAYKAARAVMAASGIKSGVRIHIKKRIPVSAGLGGGSSNAAFVMLGLNRLWNLRLSGKKLMKIGAKLGADVNFFLSGRTTAIGTGIGSNLLPAKLPKSLWFVLITSEKGLSTKEAYRIWDNIYYNNRAQGSRKINLSSRGNYMNKDSAKVFAESSKIYAPARLTAKPWVGKFCLTQALGDVKILLHSIQKNAPNSVKKPLHNDLEQAALFKDRTIADRQDLLKGLLARTPAVLMSGSGPSVFAIVGSGKEARGLRDNLIKGASKAFFKGKWRVFAVKSY